MRHRQRHLHKTVVEHVRQTLLDTAWLGPGPINWGEPAVTLLEYEPQEAGETPARNTVAISIGNQNEDENEELGGGLHSCRYTLFIDIYPTRDPIGVAIADDIKFELVETIIPLLDFTTDPAGVPTPAQIEFETVVVEAIPTTSSTLDKRVWRAVKATAVCYF